VIPFAPAISDYVAKSGSLPLSTRRAFKRVLSAIKTIALLHQKQRSRDDLGRVIAEMPDYAIAYQLMKDAFLEGLGQKQHYTDKRLEIIFSEGKITAKRLAEIIGVSVAAISQWLNPLISKGVLIWCDESGVHFQNEEALEKAKRSGKAYIRINGTFGLPSPFELTGDERWSPGGKLFREYDLELENADDQRSYNDADVETALNNEDDRDKIIDFSRMHQPGVKVLSEKMGSQNKNIGNNGDGSAISSEYSADRLTKELSGILSF
jgi:DNA primase